MPETILEIKQLKKTYGKSVVALRGVDLKVSEGEFVVVLGPSGAGKSTLMRCINKLVKPTSGEIYLDGQRIDHLRGKSLMQARANISMVFQHYNLIDRTNVLKNVLYGRLGSMSLFDSVFNRFTAEQRDTAVSLLKNVGLEQKIYARADELSGGQKQRVGICRALIQAPRLLLADEPIASLDPKSSDIVMKTLFEMSQKHQLSAVVNLHQVDYALKYATRIVGLKNGVVVFDDLPEKLTQAIVDSIYESVQDESLEVMELGAQKARLEGAQT